MLKGGNLLPKTDKELAVELTIAMLSHNAQLHEFAPNQGTQGKSTSPFMRADFVANQYQYLLAAVEGRIDTLKSQPKSDKK